MSRPGRPRIGDPNYYSPYVDYLRLEGTWTPVSRLANDLGRTDKTTERQAYRLAHAGLIELRRVELSTGTRYGAGHDNPTRQSQGRLEARALETP